MCLQDQRMAQGGTLDTANLGAFLGAIQLPDMTNALWFQVLDNTQNPVVVFYKSITSNTGILPRNAEYIGPLGAPTFCTRDQCGSLFLGPLFISGDGLKTYTVSIFRMDAETSAAIQPQPYP